MSNYITLYILYIHYIRYTRLPKFSSSIPLLSPDKSFRQSFSALTKIVRSEKNHLGNHLEGLTKKLITFPPYLLAYVLIFCFLPVSTHFPLYLFAYSPLSTRFPLSLYKLLIFSHLHPNLNYLLPFSFFAFLFSSSVGTTFCISSA